ncbi:MAG: DUF3131 domain-containing protein, partial [Sulfitobacter sp.]
MIARRTALGWLAASPLTFSTATLCAQTRRGPANVIVVLTDVGPHTDPDALRVVLDAFSKHRLPVSCCVETKSSDGTYIVPGSAIGGVLHHHAMQAPGLFELVPVVRNLGRLSAYFQARAICDARGDLIYCLTPKDSPSISLPQPRTIACDIFDTPVAPSGVRSGGIRNVLMQPNVSRPVQSQSWDDGVVRFIGGQRAKISHPLRIARDTIGERVIYLSANDLSALALGGLKQHAGRFAQEVLELENRDSFNTVLASDAQLRDNYDYSRYLAVHFVADSKVDAGQSEVLTAFRQQLMTEGVQSSYGAPSATLGQDGYWIDLNPNTQDASVLATLPNLQGGTPPPYHAGVLLQDQKTNPICGVNDENHLVLPTHYITDAASVSKMQVDAFGTGDHVIVISTSVLANRPIRRALREKLIALHQDAITKAVPLPAFARHVLPKSPYVTHYRRTESYGSEMGKRTAVLPKDMAELMIDAQTAWRYFEKWTDKNTGLCPATVNFATGGARRHETVTMWDVGSHINALMAAVDLGLISTKQFQRAIKRILPNIVGRRSQGRLLPQGWIRT